MEGTVNVFISYSTIDGLNLAARAAEVFSQNDCEPWVWHYHRQSGAYTFDEIAERIRDCDYVLYLCTESSDKSGGQKFERNTALAYGKDIWVVALDRAYVPPALIAFNQNVIAESEFAGECRKLVNEGKRGFPNWPRYQN